MVPKTTYRYEAIAADGEAVLGTIDAVGEAEGRDRLRSMSLSIRHFEPVAGVRASPLNAEDLASFNDQLAQLSRIGLPVEQGLRLLARDMSRGRLRRAVEAVSSELERGKTLPEAIDAHRRAFPPLYANVVEAGIRVNNLPAVLFNLSRHLDLTRRIRASVTRAVAYPVMVLLAIIVVSAFLSAYVLPALLEIVAEDKSGFGIIGVLGGRPWGAAPQTPALPMVTRAALVFGRVAPWIALIAVGLAVAWSLLWPIVRGTALGRAISDAILLRLPLFGPPLRSSMVARWCDAMHIGVAAGLDLPDSLSLASRSIGSGRLSRDTAKLIDAASSGSRLDAARPFTLLPVAVPAAVEIGVRAGTLPETLEALTTIYLRQAESRARLIPLVLTPILIVILAVILGGLMAAMFSPIAQLLRVLSGI